jgi:hypothetical protein
MITCAADLDGLDTTTLPDDQVVLAVLLAEYDVTHCAEHDPCRGPDLSLHLRREQAALAEAGRRWGETGVLALAAYGADRLRIVAQELVDLARHQPGAYLAVLTGQAAPTAPPCRADTLLSDYHRWERVRAGYSARAGYLEDHGRDQEGPEGMSLTALHEAADDAAAETADAAGSLIDHISTTAQTPTVWRTHQPPLSVDETAVIAGLLAATEEVNPDGITPGSEVWTSLRARFPAELFHQWAAAVDGRYDHTAGC